MYKQRPFATERDDGCDGNDDGDDVGPRCPGPRGSWAPTILGPGDFTENVENVPYRCPSLPLKAICQPSLPLKAICHPEWRLRWIPLNVCVSLWRSYDDIRFSNLASRLVIVLQVARTSLSKI